MQFNNFVANIVSLRTPDAKNIRARFQDTLIKLGGKYHKIGVSYEVNGTKLYQNIIISFLVEDAVEFISQEINKLTKQYLFLLEKTFSSAHKDFIFQQMSYKVLDGEVRDSDILNFLNRAKKGMKSDDLFGDLLAITHKKYDFKKII